MVSLAARGDLDPNVMLFKEGSNRRVRAGTLRTLLAGTSGATNLPDASKTPVLPSTTPRDLQGLMDYINSLDAAIQSVAMPPMPLDVLPLLNKSTEFVAGPAVDARPQGPSTALAKTTPTALPNLPMQPFARSTPVRVVPSVLTTDAPPIIERRALPSPMVALVAGSVGVLCTVAVVLGFLLLR